VGAGKTIGTVRGGAIDRERRTDEAGDRRDYDPVEEAKHPTPPGRRKKAAKDRRKGT
jgi:hypothetical protein